MGKFTRANGCFVSLDWTIQLRNRKSIYALASSSVFQVVSEERLVKAFVVDVAAKRTEAMQQPYTTPLTFFTILYCASYQH
jgi:hypothetical protein